MTPETFSFFPAKYFFIVLVIFLSQSLVGLNVTQPNGGQIFEQGDLMQIRWNGSASQVSIELTRGTSTTVQEVIVDGTGNDGAYNWSIPSNFRTGAYRIKIYETGTGTGVDYSNSTFQIVEPAPLANLTVTQPNGGETFEQGDVMPIRWNGNASQVSIELT
uniref:Ser-Thr-rich GPI-anchored membrane family protein n=1 Tax=Neolewinella persica TaxID=70998 RepID=UPI0005C5C674